MIYLFEIKKETNHDLPTFLIFSTLAVVSIWPWTKWPDILSPYFIDFSKLTMSSFFKYLKLVF